MIRLLVLILLFFSCELRAQSEEVRITSATPSPHDFAFDLGILGSSFSYERRFSKAYGIKFGAEYLGNLENLDGILSGNASDVSMTFRGVVTLTPRFYYNHKGVTSGKRRSAKYLAMRLQYLSPLGLLFIDKDAIRRLSDFEYAFPKSELQNLDIVPTWGLKTEHNRIYFEFSAGYVVHLRKILKKEIIPTTRLQLVCRVGYRI